MYGLLCIDDIAIVGHSLFKNFRLALYNCFDKNSFKDVTSVDDLKDITHLIIIDEHYIPCANIWRHDIFINELNRRNIKTIVLNFEKIYNSSFPWNTDNQLKLQTINNLTQFVSDVDDAKILNKHIVNKQFLSRDTVFEIKPQIEKNNRILFIGQLNDYYPTRRQTIDDARASGLPVDIIVTDRRLSYSEFLQKLNEYTFILNPLGTGTFLNIRFYEALKLGCIPLQQITQDMIGFYPELSNSINFINFKEITLDTLISHNIVTTEYYLEDFFKDINLTTYLQ